MITPLIQRQVEEDEEPVQMKKEGSGTPPVTSSVESSIASLRGGGQQLSQSERSFFEPRFGCDFAGVRLHVDAEAGRLSRVLGAEAFTFGPHVFFAPGSYRPASPGGRRLLAHELTHVVQQQGANPTGIQRKLLIDGKRTSDIKALLDMLEPASGFTLKHDPKTKEVSIIASRLKPPSFVLASRLETIIDDQNQDAELEVGRLQPGVGFGKFPLSGPLIQTIDVDDLTRLEAGAPGSGIALLIHELVENYYAHKSTLRDFHREVVFAESHKEALEAERLVAGELVGAGGRVADMNAPIPSGDTRSVLDYENYYLVFDHHDKRVVNARKVGRVKVSTNTINGFKAGSNVLPTSALTAIAAVVTDLEANPFATVRIEGTGQPEQDPKTRMAEVRDAILNNGKGRKGFDIRSWRNFNLVGNDTTSYKQRVVITVERPDIAAETERGPSVRRTPTGSSRRQNPRKGR